MCPGFPLSWRFDHCDGAQRDILTFVVMGMAAPPIPSRKTIGDPRSPHGMLANWITIRLGPEKKKKKKRDFSWQKPWGHFHKTVICDQKSKKLPNDRHNERAVVRISIENNAEISDSSALAWHCVTGTFLDGCFKLIRLSFLNKNGNHYWHCNNHDRIRPLVLASTMIVLRCRFFKVIILSQIICYLSS